MTVIFIKLLAILLNKISEMNYSTVVRLAEFIDGSAYLSNTLSGLSVVALAAYITKTYVLSPKFELDDRKFTQDRNLFALVINNKRSQAFFDAEKVSFFLIVKKEDFDKGIELFAVHNFNWVKIDPSIQDKKIKGQLYKVLVGKVTQDIFPKTPTMFLRIKLDPSIEHLEFYYAFTTLTGTFPRKFDAETTERGELPQYTIFRS